MENTSNEKPRRTQAEKWILLQKALVDAGNLLSLASETSNKEMAIIIIQKAEGRIKSAARTIRHFKLDMKEEIRHDRKA